MSRTHRIWKVFVAYFLIFYFIFASLLFRLLIRDPRELRQAILALLHRKSKVLLGGLGIQVTVEGKENFRPGQNYLIVANHLSYLDPILMASIQPMAFVTSVEMRETFFLGTLTDLGGCLYVERRSKENMHREIGSLTDALAQGFNVVVFPEATSTNGSSVRPFKKPLFMAAVNAGRNVLPVVLQYEQIDGQKVTIQNRDDLCWYGDMDFGAHFVKLLGHKKIRIRVSVMPEIEVAPGADRDTIMGAAYNVISSAYRPIV